GSIISGQYTQQEITEHKSAIRTRFKQFPHVWKQRVALKAIQKLRVSGREQGTQISGHERLCPARRGGVLHSCTSAGAVRSLGSALAGTVCGPKVPGPSPAASAAQI